MAGTDGAGRRARSASTRHRSAHQWLAIVAAEMLVGGVGIGFFIWDSRNSSRISDIMLALVYVVIIGFCLDRTIAVLGRLVTRGTASRDFG